MSIYDSRFDLYELNESVHCKFVDYFETRINAQSKNMYC